MKWIGTIFQMLAVAIVVGVVVFWFARGGGGGSTAVTVDQVKKIAQLATVDYHLSVWRYHEKPPVGLEWLPAKLFVIVRGNINGSVDLKQTDITITNEKDTKNVKIVFRKGAVLVSNPEIGPDDVTFVAVSNPNPFHPLGDKDYSAAEKEAIQQMIKTVNEDGIKAKTAREAKTVLENFLMALGFAADISFEDKLLNGG